MTRSGIVLRVPGPWSNHAELEKVINAASSGQARLAIEPHDPDLQRAMFVGSGRSLDGATNSAIGQHRLIACVSFAKASPGIETVVANSLAVLREGGGYAVNVPQSGLSHSWDRWQKIMAKPSADGLLQALVLQVPDRVADRLCSFGMKQFGQPDACVTRDATSAEAAWVVFEFNRYTWVQQPALKTGQTFSRHLPNAIRYKLVLAEDRRYETAHDFHNPAGIWEMSPIPGGR